MNVRDIEAFIAVVETGSIVAASTRLHITQPGLTRRIQSLEESLFTTLLDRAAKPLKPTTAGRLVYEHGLRVLRAMRDLSAAVSPEGEVSGEFKLGVTPSLADVCLAGPLNELRANFAALLPRITSSWPAGLLQGSLRGELDAAVIYLPEGVHPPRGLQGERVLTERARVVASADLRLPRSVRLRDLASYPWVVNEDGCGFRAAIRHAFDSAHLPFNIAVEAQNAELRFSLIARGYGIGLATRVGLASSPSRKSLKLTEVDELRDPVHIWVVHRPPVGKLEKPIRLFTSSLTQALTRL